MQLQTKKIIAREFLILTLTALIGFVGFLGTYSNNYFKKTKIDKLEENIVEKNRMSDSLSKSYNIKVGKQNRFFNKYFDKVNREDTEFNTSDKLWKRLSDLAQKDSIKYKWKNVWNKELISFLKETGFSDGDNFNSFIVTNTITTSDFENYNHSAKLNQEIKELKSEKDTIRSKILSINQQIAFGFKCFIVASIILFGARYLFYAVRWSIRTLKQPTK